jgi:hypothetical protein
MKTDTIVKDISVRYLHVTSADEAIDALKGIQIDEHNIRELTSKMLPMNIVIEGIDSK